MMCHVQIKELKEVTLVYPVSKSILLDGIEERLLFPASPSSLCLGTPEREPTAVDLLVAVPSPVITDFCARGEAFRAQLNIGAVRAAKPQVEDEWQELLALKQHTAVMALTQRLGKQAAQAKVESALVAEQLRQDELVKLRLQHIKLKIKIEGLEAELREREEDRRDPLQLQFQQLQAMRLEQRKLFEKQSEESSKLQTKIVSGLELLSNIKEKLFWDQMEVQCKREQLAEVEATVARKRDLLTRTKQAWNRLQKDNLRLKECRGLLGNRVLLQDFEKTVDASDHLEEEMENLKSWKAEITLKFLH
uniref:CCDC113/CCDC96 coiled-coil domain-containing protein n=1 Tax=Echeneis naucrates TaxID=173247 RepID=A0A665TW52_ECHNA